jgi:hypothetical protein
MRPVSARLLLIVMLCACLAGATADVTALFGSHQTAAPANPSRWYKGNTHTHTLNSDGDSTPDEVVRWYREHGYQFLVLTDHNFQTRVEGLNGLHGADERFLVIRGEEVTSSAGGKPVHVNGLDTARPVGSQSGAAGSAVADVLQRSVDGIRAASGVPHINHPNFRWAFSTEELQRVNNYKLLEIFNGHPEVNNQGGGGVPGLEEIWDRLLSSGRLVYGIAVDDAHVFKQPGNTSASGPGRGWVMVRAPQLDPKALLDSLERGNFYASNGVVLNDVAVSASSMTVTVAPQSTAKYRIQFIGNGGRILNEVPDVTGSYAITGSEGYVRARVLDSNGHTAWVQPVLTGR